MATRITKALGAAAALGVSIGVWSAEANALTYLGNFSGNDCGAGGFSNCYATQTGTTNSSTAGGSPSIFKKESGGGTEISSLFPSITGSEFAVTYTAATNKLSFTYTPGANDPEVHYFTVKQANGFALFYDAAAITSGEVLLDSYFPRNPGYSHITFFDTKSGTGGNGGAVPEPATWAMMLLGFGAMGMVMRRRRKQTANVRFAF